MHRFEEARFLLENSPHFTAAVYLAGYAIECGLKAVILANTPPKRHQETKDSFRGKVAHNFDWLRHQLIRRKVVIPEEIVHALGDANWWGTDLRYQSSQVEGGEAEDFLKATETIVSWARRSI